MLMMYLGVEDLLTQSAPIEMVSVNVDQMLLQIIRSRKRLQAARAAEFRRHRQIMRFGHVTFEFMITLEGRRALGTGQ